MSWGAQPYKSIPIGQKKGKKEKKNLSTRIGNNNNKTWKKDPQYDPIYFILFFLIWPNLKHKIS